LIPLRTSFPLHSFFELFFGFLTVCVSSADFVIFG
jgi:hypothetical protein